MGDCRFVDTFELSDGPGKKREREGEGEGERERSAWLREVLRKPGHRWT
jgi:hypothetical protein